jgi:hypothetical protein
MTEPEPTEERYPCPCCGNLTLSEKPPGTFAMCEVCWWEDDHLQHADPLRERGANGPSLEAARLNYLKFGASDPDLVEQVRAPRPEELPS